VVAFGAPAIDGLGTTGGFKLYVDDRANAGPVNLQAATNALIDAANRSGSVQAMVTSYNTDPPQLYVDLDRNEAKTMGVPLTEIFDALQTFLGSAYANDFTYEGRNWQLVGAHARAGCHRNLARDRRRGQKALGRRGGQVVLDVGRELRVTVLQRDQKARPGPPVETGECLERIPDLSPSLWCHRLRRPARSSGRPSTFFRFITARVNAAAAGDAGKRARQAGQSGTSGL
jgi:hypothetical protein